MSRVTSIIEFLPYPCLKRINKDLSISTLRPKPAWHTCGVMFEIQA